MGSSLWGCEESDTAEQHIDTHTSESDLTGASQSPEEQPWVGLEILHTHQAPR